MSKIYFVWKMFLLKEALSRVDSTSFGRCFYSRAHCLHIVGTDSDWNTTSLVRSSGWNCWKDTCGNFVQLSIDSTWIGGGFDSQTHCRHTDGKDKLLRLEDDSHEASELLNGHLYDFTRSWTESTSFGRFFYTQKLRRHIITTSWKC